MTNAISDEAPHTKSISVLLEGPADSAEYIAKCSTGTESAEDVKFLPAVTAVKPVHVSQRAFSCFSFRCVQDGY